MTLRDLLRVHGYDGDEILDLELATRHRNGVVINAKIQSDICATVEVEIYLPARANRLGEPVE